MEPMRPSTTLAAVIAAVVEDAVRPGDTLPVKLRSAMTAALQQTSVRRANEVTLVTGAIAAVHRHCTTSERAQLEAELALLARIHTEPMTLEHLAHLADELSAQSGAPVGILRIWNELLDESQ